MIVGNSLTFPLAPPTVQHLYIFTRNIAESNVQVVTKFSDHIRGSPEDELSGC